MEDGQVCNHKELDEPGAKFNESIYKAMAYPWWGLSVLLPIVWNNAFNLLVMVPPLILPSVNLSAPIWIGLSIWFALDTTSSDYFTKLASSEWWPISYFPR